MTPRRISRTAFGLLALSLAPFAPLATPVPAAAQSLSSEPVLRRTIHVPRDKSLSFRLPQAASRIVIAQPDIAKVTATSDSSFYVQGINDLATPFIMVFLKYKNTGKIRENKGIYVNFLVNSGNITN